MLCNNNKQNKFTHQNALIYYEWFVITPNFKQDYHTKAKLNIFSTKNSNKKITGKLTYVALVLSNQAHFVPQNYQNSLRVSAHHQTTTLENV